MSNVPAGELIAIVKQDYDALLAELKKPDKKSEAVGFWVWSWVFWAMCLFGPFMPLAAMTVVPADQEAFHNVVPAVKWVAVSVFLFGSAVFGMMYLSFIAAWCLRDAATASDPLELRKANNVMASFAVTLGVFRDATVRGHFRTAVNVLAVFSLWAAACYTSGGLMLLAVMALKFSRIIASASGYEWLKSLPLPEIVRLKARPWETHNTDDPAAGPRVTTPVTP